MRTPKVKSLKTWFAILACLSPMFIGAQGFFLGSEPVPEEQDGAFQFWNNLSKFFLIVAADKYLPGSQLPFAKVDADSVANKLTDFHYQKIDILTGERATRDNFITALKSIKSVASDSLVVIYYSGHGVTDSAGKNVFLQMYGQPVIDANYGVTLSEVVDTVRQGGYEGQLAIFIDACFSGQGVLSSALTLKDVGKNTTILTSCSETQESYAVELPGKKQMSAFTYLLLKALAEDWDVADKDNDGIMEYAELKAYVAGKLEIMSKSEEISGPMLPSEFSNYSEMVLALDRKRTKNWKSLRRATFVAISILFIKPVGGSSSTTKMTAISSVVFKKIRSASDTGELVRIISGKPTEPSPDGTVGAKVWAEVPQGVFDAVCEFRDTKGNLIESRFLGFSSNALKGITLPSGFKMLGNKLMIPSISASIEVQAFERVQ
ncbi:MAG: caspase family protein [Acidobacteria bacterium]|nr:caspase family protein [Acidobacteriota bacterium]MCI0724969.1 caspase family protein [Acidobacteriota bacterium]